MSLLTGIGKKLARNQVNRARQGKEGQDAMKVIGFLDGYKRVILLLLYLAVEWVRATGHGDYSGYLSTVVNLLGWDAAGTLPVPATLIAGTVATLLAIWEGIVKARAARAEAAKLVR